MPATLTPVEIAAVRAAETMTRLTYPEGGIVAVNGRTRLFAAGSPEAFEQLWRQAERIRAEVVAQ